MMINKYGMVMIMINLLSGMKAMKNVRHRKQKLRKNFCPLPGILIVQWIGVFLKTRKKRQKKKKKYGHKHRLIYVW